MRVLFVIALAAWGACSARGAAGPSWPGPRAGEVDGGESLAPRAAARAIAAVVEEEKPADRGVAERPAAPAPVPVTAPAAADRSAAAPAAAPEDPLTTEEIVIEVDD